MKKENRKIPGKIWIMMPLILGILSFLSFAVYRYSANHAPYTYTDIILAGPVCSFIGVMISIVTRRGRNRYPALWWCGLITCACGFIVCVLVILLLLMVMIAAVHGTWL